MLENKNKHPVLVDNLNLEYFFCHHFGTTTQIILRDSALLLTEAVTKFNRLLKYSAINGGGRFYLQRRSENARLQK